MPSMIETKSSRALEQITSKIFEQFLEPHTLGKNHAGKVVVFELPGIVFVSRFCL